MNYRFVYKCRLCQQTDDSHGAGNNWHAVIGHLVNANMGIVSEPMAPRLTSAHNCSDGKIGISDLIGAVPEGEKE